jgi:hypothetical protein
VEKPPLPIGWEARWAREPVWTLWRRKNLALARNKTLTVQLIARRYTD